MSAALTKEIEPVAWKFVSPLGTVRKFQDRSPVLADPEAHFWTALYTVDQLSAAVLAERERAARLLESTDLSKLPNEWKRFIAQILTGYAEAIRGTGK